MKLRLSNAPCSWGIEFANSPNNPLWNNVLDELSGAGYKATELGPLGYLPTDAGELSDELEKRDLKLIAGTLFHHLHDPSRRDEILAFTRESCQVLQQQGAEFMVVIDHVNSPRTDEAGQIETATRLPPEQWDGMMETIRQAARICLDHGITPVLHAHTGTYIEYRDELDRAMNDLDADLVSLCIDTGHCYYAGMDPAEIIRTYADRIRYLHFKDINPSVHQQTITEGVDFYSAISNGIFCPLGEGAVDFADVRSSLEEINFDGWVTVEQDMDPTKDANPLNNARNSREFIEKELINAA